MSINEYLRITKIASNKNKKHEREIAGAIDRFLKKRRTIPEHKAEEHERRFLGCLKLGLPPQLYSDAARKIASEYD